MKNHTESMVESKITFSVVIPVYNEEAIVEMALRSFLPKLREFEENFELIVAANGCVDSTISIVENLRSEFPEICVLNLPTPDYGAALRDGILAAQGEYVLCDEIDLCDIDFHRRALRKLRSGECDFVVGSKAMRGARDKRPAVRRVATKVVNMMLWATLGFQGTDTHGLKAFRRAVVLPVVHKCKVTKDLFASELVIRAGRETVRVIEIPIELEEQRRPSIHLFKRVPRVLKDMAQLVYHIRRD
jgi:glycosyltransferase involved in cell wall biosynthesis